MKLVHYYHLYANGNWHEPWTEHIQSVIDSGLYDELDSFKVSLVGRSANRQEAIDVVSQFDKVEIVAESNGGFEQQTLDVLYAEAMASEEEIYFIYAHTKGAAFFRPINTWWRRDMTKNVIGRWKEAVDILDQGYDAAGIFWRRSPELGKRSPVLHSHFSGNFWWAKSSYIRTLGPLQRNTRYDAEAWIGYNEAIKSYDMYPGYPKIQGPVSHPEARKLAFDGRDYITLYVNSKVGGPHGKLMPGQTVHLPDSPYVQVLIRSGAVTVWS